MKLNKLTIGLTSVAFASLAVSAHAASLNRTYNNGGTSISIDGTIAPSYNKRISTFEYLRNDSRAFDMADEKGIVAGTLEEVLASKSQDLTDERLRMSGVNNSYINIGVNQMLTHNINAYTNLGLVHTPNSDAFVVGDISFYDYKVGSVTLGASGYLPTSSVATSSTYNVLDSQAGGYIAGEYTKIANLTLGGYYAFAELHNGNPMDIGLRRGYGATASYKHSFAARNNLSMRAGFSKGERRGDLADNRVARDQTGYMLGLKYDYYDLSLGLDGGVSNADFYGNVINDAKTTAVGARLGYDFTPRVSAYGYYGVQETKSNASTGVTLDTRTLLNNTVPFGTRAIDERQLFKTIKSDMYGIGVRYRHNSNLSFNASAGSDNTKYSLSDGDFAKQKNQNYTVGVSFSF